MYPVKNGKACDLAPVFKALKPGLHKRIIIDELLGTPYMLSRCGCCEYLHPHPHVRNIRIDLGIRIRICIRINRCGADADANVLQIFVKIRFRIRIRGCLPPRIRIRILIRGCEKISIRNNPASSDIDIELVLKIPTLPASRSNLFGLSCSPLGPVISGDRILGHNTAKHPTTITSTNIVFRGPNTSSFGILSSCFRIVSSRTYTASRTLREHRRV
uniref:SFRICE_017717 n=1 Tax=Spodoptera frugiperda TaxID=7108 RepID=A0A2H1WGV0_SPOFR